MKPHQVKTFYWRNKQGWCSNEWPWRGFNEQTTGDIMRNLRTGWVMVATLNNGQKVRYAVRKS